MPAAQYRQQPGSTRPGLQDLDEDQRVAARTVGGIDRLEFKPALSALATHHQDPLANGMTDLVLDDFDSLGMAGNGWQSGRIVRMADVVVRRMPGAGDWFIGRHAGRIVLLRPWHRRESLIRLQRVFHGVCPVESLRVARFTPPVAAGYVRAGPRSCGLSVYLYRVSASPANIACVTGAGGQTLDCRT